MKKQIVLTTRQQQDGEVEETQLTATGTLEPTEGGLLLRYREPSEEGTLGAVVCITLKEQHILLERRGETRSRMMFSPGKRHLCRYDTPYGPLTMHTTCTELCQEVERHGGRAFAAYQLELGESEPLLCTMEILVKDVSR